MFDMMWTNLAQAFLEAINFLIWAVPRVVKFVGLILTPIVLVFGLGLLVISAGWRNVVQNLIERWVEKGWQIELINNHNIRWATGAVTILANMTVLSGLLLNLLVVLFTALLLWEHGDFLLSLR